ncbi:MAG: LysR family transcriptional regulator [Micropepsaceae bacterium]
MSDGDLWTLYRSFLAVMREGSLSGAAAALTLSQPTLGRHIEALEQRLGGIALFTRHPRGLLPTEAAREMLPHIEAMHAGAEAARWAATTAKADAVSGTVRIAASETVGAEVLPGILAPLRARHPGLSFELSLSIRSEDLLRRDSDIAVRMVQPEQGALLAVKTGTVKLGLFAHRSYAARHGLPATMADLANHAVIGFDRTNPFIDSASRALKLDRAMFALRVDHELASLAALRAGFGLGVCQKPIAKRDGDLVPVLEREIAFTLGTWVVMHGDLKRVPRMKTVFDHLAREMRAYTRSWSS